MEIFFVVLICLILFYAISEFFGRSKHIGRNWSFALLATSFLFGIIAIIASPSAKEKPTDGNQNHKIFGWIFIILGILSLFALNPLSIGFIVLGLYLIELSKGNIENKNPKFYFSQRPNFEIKTPNQSFNFQKREQNSNSKNISEHIYYIIENNGI